MTRQSEKVLEEALHLSPIERAEIVERLLSSFEFSDRAAVDNLWAIEAESRIDAYERGEIGTISAKDVFRKMVLPQNLWVKMSKMGKKNESSGKVSWRDTCVNGKNR